MEKYTKPVDTTVEMRVEYFTQLFHMRNYQIFEEKHEQRPTNIPVEETFKLTANT